MVTLKRVKTPESEVSKALMEEKKAVEKVEYHLTAQDLKHDLGGTLQERLLAEKTVFVSIKSGQKPEVIFTGFWNGKMVHNAQNALARAYRSLVHKNMRAQAQQPK